jgi:hypothetical protein
MGLCMCVAPWRIGNVPAGGSNAVSGMISPFNSLLHRPNWLSICFLASMDAGDMKGSAVEICDEVLRSTAFCSGLPSEV